MWSKNLGRILLVLTTALWGSTFIIVKLMVHDVPPATVNFVRFTIAAIALSPFLRRERRLWLAGAELSIWLFAGYASQSIGLKFTSANHSAFITAMYVIFVPLISSLTGTRTSRLIWLAAITAVIGCGLLSYDGGAPNRGDVWTIVTAITYAFYIIRIGKHATSFASLPLTLAQMAPVALLCGIWTAAEHAPLTHLPWAGLVYLGVAATAGTTWMQAVAQRTVPPAQAAVIFTLEPVFAALFSFLVVHETLGLRGIIGGGMIVLAAIMSQLHPAQNTPAPIGAVSR